MAADNFLKYRTLCDFRKQHLSAFREVFVQVIRIASKHKTSISVLPNGAMNSQKNCNTASRG